MVGGGLAITMMAGHERFLEYIHRTEVRLLEHRLSTLGRPRVLDLGCGAGRLAVALAPLASSVLGIELAESLVIRARTAAEASHLRNVRFEVGSVEDALPASSFDAVVVSGVLNSVDDETVARCLRNIATALAPNGILYIRNHCSTRRRFFRPESKDQPPCTFRTSTEYLQAVSNVPGLEVIEERYLFPPVCLPNLVYYHGLPKRFRDHPAVRRMLSAWFELEERTSERRLRWFGRIYPTLLRLIRKPTAFRILVARRAATL